MSAPIAPEFRDAAVPWRLLEDYRPLNGVTTKCRDRAADRGRTSRRW